MEDKLDHIKELLQSHVESQSKWEVKMEGILYDIDKCLNGNGKPGIKAQLFAIWLIGGALTSFVLFIAYKIFIEGWY